MGVIQFCIKLVRWHNLPRRNVPTLVAVLAVLTTVTACDHGRTHARGLRVTEVDSGGVSIVMISGSVADLPTWRLSDQPKTEISGHEPPYLGSIGEVEFLGNGSLLVEDNQTDEIRLFDSTGTVIRVIGVAGRGPGEFRSVTTLTVTAGDTAYTYDRRLYRVSGFDAAGGLVRTFALSREDGGFGTLALDVWAFDSDHFLLHRLSPWNATNAELLPRRDQRDVMLFALDGTGRVRTKPIRFTGGYTIEGDHGDAWAPFSNEPIVAVGANRIVHSSALVYELTIRTPDLRPVRIVRWSGWPKPLTEGAIQTVRAAVEANLEELLAQRPDLVQQLVEAQFSPNLLPEMLPALGSALVDEGGRIWVARFRPRTELWSEEDSWHLLDPDGRPVARVELPPHSRLAAVRRDRVALIMRDSLDVEHLRVFALRTGTEIR